MCEFTSKLVAWLDRELPDEQLDAIDRHLSACSECREQADSFREVSRAFAVYARAVPPQPARPVRAGLVIPVAIAAAALLAVLVLSSGRHQEMQPDSQHVQRSAASVPQRSAPQSVAMLPHAAPARVAIASRPHHSKRPHRQSAWMPVEPTIQILIPADALFPPGALPEGVDFVADLRPAAEGSPASLALRP
jgi:hypothetical protein